MISLLSHVVFANLKTKNRLFNNCCPIIRLLKSPISKLFKAIRNTPKNIKNQAQRVLLEGLVDLRGRVARTALGVTLLTSISMVDYSGGLMAALGMVSAILGARSTGQGCDVDVSLFDNAIAHLAYLGAWHLTEGYQPQRWPDSSHPSQVPSQVLPTKDGWLVVMCAKEKFYENLVTIMGAPELAIDPRFKTFKDRLDNRHLLGNLLKKLSSKKTTSVWLSELRGKVPCAPVNTVEQALKDPLIEQNRMITSAEHPDLGTIKQPANPIKIGDLNPNHRLGPKLGEHTDKILQDYANATKAEIETWRTEGVI